MIIDSDSDEQPSGTQPAPEKREFELREEELDSDRPFSDIFRSVNIPLGAKVLAIAVPIAATQSVSASATPPILSSRIVVAAVCSDYRTRIISISLTPPYIDDSTEDPDADVFEISAAGTHPSPSSKIALTFTQGPAKVSSAGPTDRSQHSTSRTSSRDLASSSKEAGSWEVLMAVHSHESTGSILIYRIPILQKESGSELSYSFSSRHIRPVQAVFLRTPPTAMRFNPSPYPSERHSHLLISSTNGAVKLFACILPGVRSTVNRSSSTSDAEQERPADGKWLISLFPGFAKSPSGTSQRKPVIAAEWVLGGRAIVALLADGEWGVWDIEGTGPGAAQTLVRGQTNVQGVTGGALASFAINGWVSSLDSNPSTDLLSESKQPQLAPMTPGTRKTREDLLFKAPATRPENPIPSTSSSPGHISVLPHSLGSRSNQPDECIVLQHRHQDVVIPSLLSFWRSKVKKTGTFEASSRFRPFDLKGVNLSGEQQLGISQFPVPSSTVYTPSFGPSSPRYPDILIATEHRLSILAAPLVPSLQPEQAAEAAGNDESRPGDQTLLTIGELDIEGMDRIMEGMSNGTIRRSPSKGRKVGFV